MDSRLSVGTFRRNRDGSWTCVAPVSFDGPIGRIRLSPGASFARGAVYKGVDIAAFLNVQAREREPTASRT
ncbi:MAG TPA: hypothetical protein VFB08_01970 [Burkholderiales bacterium]|nr:hypothetical protein [Burkholderiales bacterium]